MVWSDLFRLKVIPNRHGELIDELYTREIKENWKYETKRRRIKVERFLCR